MTDGKSGVGAGLTMHRTPASTSVVPDFDPLVGLRIFVPQQHNTPASTPTASMPQLVQWYRRPSAPASHDTRREKQARQICGSRCHAVTASRAGTGGRGLPTFPTNRSKFFTIPAPSIQTFSPQHPLPQPTTTTPSPQHHPFRAIPQQLHHQLFSTSRMRPAQNPHLPIAHIPHSPTHQWWMLHRGLTLCVPALEPLVSTVLTRHAHIAPDQPQVRSMAPRTNPRATQRTHARIRYPSVLRPQWALPAPKQPFRHRTSRIGLRPHPRASRHLQAGAQSFATKHPPPR